MSKGREIRFYDYVNRPFEQVREALRQDAPAVFQSATAAASSRALRRIRASRRSRRHRSRSPDTGLREERRRTRRCRHDRSNDPTATGMASGEDAGPFPFHAGGAFDLSFNRERNPIGFLRRLRTAAGACGKGVERRCRPPNRGSLRPPVRCRCSRLSQKDAVSARMTIFPRRNQFHDEPARKMGSSDNTTDERPSHVGIIPKIAPRATMASRRKNPLPEVLKTFGLATK